MIRNLKGFINIRGTLRVRNLKLMLEVLGNDAVSKIGNSAAPSLKSAGDCLCEEEAQGWNRVRHMALRSSGCREGRNFGVRQAFLVERSFFWSRYD